MTKLVGPILISLLSLAAVATTAAAGDLFYVVQNSITRECMVVDVKPRSPEWSILVGTGAYLTPYEAVAVMDADPTCKS